MALEVIVSGAGGKMGREVLKAVSTAADMKLVGAVDPGYAGADAGDLAGMDPFGMVVTGSLEEAFQAAPDADCVVDFTMPQVVYKNVLQSLKAGRRVVFGTTGLSDAQLSHIDTVARSKNLGVIHAPNFALGAILMMRFAAEAARYCDGVEIIELHHDQKKDAPSGTAIKTAELIAEARAEHGAAKEPVASEDLQEMEGARGALVQDVPIHSVRLAGLVAHQEVIFGFPGQTLTIRHDSMDRTSFMPGVLLALRKVKDVTGLLYGLEHLI